MIIAVVNLSSQCPQDKLDFWIAACCEQMIEFCKVHEIEPTPVVPFDYTAPIPEGCRIMAIVDKLDVDGALGYHTDAAGDIYGRVLYQGDATSVTLSHECLEEVADPTCDQWYYDDVRRRHVAQEVCDPVEEDTYKVSVTIAGETREVELSNFITPEWSDTSSKGPYDRLGNVKAPFSMTAGGYMVVIDDGDEEEKSIFASHGSGHQLAASGAYIVGQIHPEKFRRNDSRTLERLRQECL